MSDSIYYQFLDKGIDRAILEQIYAGFTTDDNKKLIRRVFDIVGDHDIRIYPITITFKTRSRGLSDLNDRNEHALKVALYEISQKYKFYTYLLPAFQSDYTLHYHGILISIPVTSKDTGLTFSKYVRAYLNRKIGFCKITNLRKDNKKKIYSPTDALDSVINYAKNEDNYGGILYNEYKILSTIPPENFL